MNPSASMLPPIVITSPDNGTILWDVTQPHNGATSAAVYSAPDPGGPWALVTANAWSDGEYLDDLTTAFWAIQGQLVDLTPRTQLSNAVSWE